VTNIILIGFMGCGKSSLGKKIAKKLNYHFIDSDSEIEKIHQLSVPEIFKEKGEDFFRQLEADFIRSIPKDEPFVLSTGGGTPCYHDNLSFLHKIGKTFYLQLSPYELTQRLIKAKVQRPLLINKNEDELYNFIKEKLADRLPYYSQANYTLKGKEQKVDSVLNKLIF
jgi:shikimate kinase